jgi:hypothetical protein
MTLISQRKVQAQNNNPHPPYEPIKLIFIHHSCGENWLMDENGELGRTLGENNYFVSDTNYGWGPDSIGDATDYYNWYDWFLGPESSRYLEALYTESGQNSDYTRIITDPGGENEIIIFKSCFPNSDLAGNSEDPAGDVEWYTVSHAKFIYNQLLDYFSTRPDKLFIAITPPPLLDFTHAENAREFSRWLVEDWLIENNYQLKNVGIWDFHNVLTHPDNHHYYQDGNIEYIIQNGNGTLFYDSDGDEHPNIQGNKKSTIEFVPMLNVIFNRWVETTPPPIVFKDAEPTPQEELESTPESLLSLESITPEKLGSNVIDDFEGEPPSGTNGWEAFWDDATNSSITCELDQNKAHTGVSSMRIDFHVKPGGWATCPLFFDRPPDFSNSQGLSFAYQSSTQGLTFDINAHGGTPEARSTYLNSITTSSESVSGWTLVEQTWDQITRASWEENAGTSINPAEINGFAFGFNAESDSTSTGTIWIDNLRLITKKRTSSESSDLDETQQETPSDDPVITDIEIDSDSPGERSRFCPGSIPLIPLMAFFIVIKLKSLKHKEIK